MVVSNESLELVIFVCVSSNDEIYQKHVLMK